MGYIILSRLYVYDNTLYSVYMVLDLCNVCNAVYNKICEFTFINKYGFQY